MLTPGKVQLVPHDPTWISTATAEGDLLANVLGETLLHVFHIGSTSIPGIAAKPIIDLLPVVSSLWALDRHKKEVERLGYHWRGEYGLPGRRYGVKDDPATGRRLIQAHFYAVGSPEIDRHVAFRNYLLERPELAQAYLQEKARCQQCHRHDSHAYSDCKNDWIKRIEKEALRYYGFI